MQTPAAAAPGGKHSEWAVSLAHHSCTYRLSDKIMKALGRRNDLQNGLDIQMEQTAWTDVHSTPSGQ